MVLLTTRTDSAIKFEILSHGSIAQVVGCIIDEAPLHHVTILSRCNTAHEFVGTFQEGGLTHHHLLQVLGVNALGIHHLHQRQVGIVGLKLLQRHLIVVGFRVAEFGTRLGDLSQSRLHLHDVLHLLGSCTLTETKELEHLDYVLLKCFTDIRCSLVVIQVILFLTK